MKKALIAASVATVCAAVFGVTGFQTTLAAGASAKVEDFQLTDHTRLAHELYYYKYAPAIVLMTRTNGTAFSRDASAELEKLQAAYKDKGVLFFMMDSKATDTRDAVAAEAAAQHITIPVLMDEYQLVGESMGVQREGEVFVIDPKDGFNLAYRGPLDNRFTDATPNIKAAATNAFTVKALDAILAGRPAPQARIDMKVGAVVPFDTHLKADAAVKITYAKDIAPILQDKCVGCHIAGGIAPFAMTGYDVIKNHASMIRETVRTRRMPPYFPDPHIGAFKNDQGLTADQTKMLVHWIEAGAPRGDGSDPLLVNVGKVAPEWPAELGKPDVIVNIPSFDVPATGVIEYQNQRVANPFPKDTWLRAISIKPGDARVLHHVVSNYSGPPGDIPSGSVGSYTPGARPQVMGDDTGAPVPGGGTLNFQMHYTVIGTPVTDHTQVGFYVLKDTPKYIKRSVVIGDQGLTIPAGDPHHTEIAYLTFPADAYVYTLYPHSHYRGMHVELKQKTPDGKETMLLSLPKYDFNWQRDYDPVQPLLVKAGTKLIATWVYDNSAHNAANPDPTKTVTWGEQTFNEMMYFRINYRFADETSAHLRPDLTAALAATQAFGMLDDNADDKITRDELVGPRNAAMLANFAMLDRDGNGYLDHAEFAAAQGAGRGGARGGAGRGAPAQPVLETPDL